MTIRESTLNNFMAFHSFFNKQIVFAEQSEATWVFDTNWRATKNIHSYVLMIQRYWDTKAFTNVSFVWRADL